MVTFEVLRDIGSRFGYKSRYSKKYGGPGEWLWDFAWCEHDSKSNNILSLPLVAESEWTLKNVRYDFKKLLVAYAPLRFIILQSDTENLLINKITELEPYSLAYHGTPAHYLAAGWVCGDPQTDIFEPWATVSATINTGT